MAISGNASINVDDLKRAGVTWDKTLATIMPAMFSQVAEQLGIGLYKMANNSHNLRTFIRKGDMLKPYEIGAALQHSELGEVSERELTLRHAVISAKDDISTYADSDRFEPVSFNPAKPKHPLEKTILFAIAKTMAEDILDNLFFAEYDYTGTSAVAAFDGYWPIIDMAISQGEVDTPKGNVFPLGNDFTAPADETDIGAYTSFIQWIKNASPKLLRGRGTKLIMPMSAATFIKQAYANKVRGFRDPTWDELVAAIRTELMAPNLEIVATPYIGTGSRMILTSLVDNVSLQQNLVFGYNQNPDSVFLNINQSPDNVNVVYFQSDIKVGAQIRSFNKNVFFCTHNSGIPSNTPPALSGDE